MKIDFCLNFLNEKTSLLSTDLLGFYFGCYSHNILTHPAAFTYKISPGMDSGRITLSSHSLNKGFGLNFPESCLLRQTSEECWRIQRLKCYDYNNQDKDTSQKKRNQFIRIIPNLENQTKFYIM